MAEAIVQLQNHVGRKFDAVVIAEIGGANSMQPLIAGRQLGIPTVDADGMGRAFPEIQMSAFVFEGDISAAPYALVDVAHRFALVPQAATEKWGERVARTHRHQHGRPRRHGRLRDEWRPDAVNRD